MANRIETSLLVKGLTADTYALDVRGKTFVDGDIEINGNVNIVGTATTINTQTVQARDNKIELNYSGSTSTAIGGGIEILSGRTDGSSVSLTIDTDRDWNSNTGFNITGRTSDATANGLKVVNSSGTNTLVVRNDGNVGIGTSTPTEKLDVNGNIKTSQGVIVDGGTYNGIRFNGTGFSRIAILNNYKFDGVFTEGFKFNNLSYDFFNYDQSGLNGDNFEIANSFIKGKNAGISDTTKYFGINVTGTPTSTLHVVGSNSSSPTALFESKATNNTAYTVRAIATTTNAQSNVGLYSYVSGGFANLGLWVEEGISCFGPFNSDSKVYIKGIDSSSSNYGLKVQNSSGTNNLVVRNDGNVGIGTSTPTSKLHTMGSFIFDNGATTQNSFMVSDDEVRLWFGKTSSNYNQGILANHSFNPKGLTFIVNEGGSTGNFAMYLTEDKNVGVGFGGNSYTGVTSRMHIRGSGTTSSGYGLKVQDSSGTDNFVVRNDGNVGIGTSTPTEKLEVSGKTKTTTLQVTSGATPGYVLTATDTDGNMSWQSSIKKYSTTLTSPTTGNYMITHNLGTTDISVTLWLVTTDEMTNANINTRTTNSVTVSFLSDVGEDVRVVVIG